MLIRQIFILLHIVLCTSFKKINRPFSRSILYSKINNFESNELYYEKEYYKYLVDYNFIQESDNFKCNNDCIDEIIEERKDKFEIFKENYKRIQEFNSQNHSFTLDINQFADTYNDTNYYNNNFNKDFIYAENYDLMKKKMTLYDIIKYDFISIKQLIEYPQYYLDKYRNISNSLIWNDRFVSSVKNQGRCGSCWAFSTTGMIESNMRINKYNTPILSTQELVDCSSENSGCGGGLMHLALDYCIENDGLVSEEDYPYNATTRICKLYNNSEINKVNGSNVKNYNFIVPRSVIDIMASLKKGPIALALDASPFEFRFYKQGVIDVSPSNYSRLNHAVLLTGYSTYENGSYWLIQNSWGEKWGDNGYVKIKIENGNGILLSQLYGVYPLN